MQRQGLAQVQGHLQELLQPIALGDTGHECEVVVGSGIHFRQSWYGRQLTGYDVRHALCQRLVVKMACYLYLTEVAVNGHEVCLVVVARLNVQLVQLVVGRRREHIEIAQVDGTHRIVDIVGVEIGCQLAEETRIAPLVAEVGGLGREIQ